jgi:hypothetical protein
MGGPPFYSLLVESRNLRNVQGDAGNVGDEEQNDDLRYQEGRNGLTKILKPYFANGTDDIEVCSHRGCNQTDEEIDTNNPTEMERMNPELHSHRMQKRRCDENGRKGIYEHPDD